MLGINSGMMDMGGMNGGDSCALLWTRDTHVLVKRRTDVPNRTAWGPAWGPGWGLLWESQRLSHEPRGVAFTFFFLRNNTSSADLGGGFGTFGSGRAIDGPAEEPATGPGGGPGGRDDPEAQGTMPGACGGPMVEGSAGPWCTAAGAKSSFSFLSGLGESGSGDLRFKSGAGVARGGAGPVLRGVDEDDRQ